MKIWENSLFKRIKAQNSSLEERITEKLAGEFEVFDYIRLWG